MLLKPSDIKLPDSSEQKRKVVSAQTGLLRFSEVGWKHLRSQIGELEHGKYHHVTTDGMWSAIHLLEYVLSQCGPSDIWLTTWSISEDAIRRLVKLHESGAVKSLKGLFDRRVKIYTPAAFHFAERHFQIKLMAIHAKVTVVKGEKMAAVIHSSANYNQNKRVESGIIITVPECLDYYISWIESYLYASE